jgi:hypothetical protein
MNYYYVDAAGTTVGPVTDKDLIEWRRQGTLDDSSFVIPEGGTDWLTFAQCLPAPAVTTAPSPPSYTSSPQRQPEQVVREQLATAGAYGRAIVGVMGEAADRIAGQVIDKANRGLGANESSGGSAAAASPAARIERIGVATTFGLLLAIALFAPAGTIQAKVGQPIQVTTWKMLSGMGSFNLWALVTVLSPAAGLASALVVRLSPWRWIGLVAALFCAIATQEAFAYAIATVQQRSHSVTGVEVSTWTVFVGPVAMLLGIYLLIAAVVAVVRGRSRVNTSFGSA